MTPQKLRELFTWDANTGRIFWKHKYKSREAFGSVQSSGYLYGKVMGKNYLAHRVLWALETGRWPNGEIDHINQNKMDNRLNNLRDVCRIENSRNKSRNKNNRSGVLGVARLSSGKWRAYITVRKKQVHLGVFDNIEDAKLARLNASQEYNFSKIHGTIRVSD